MESFIIIFLEILLEESILESTFLDFGFLFITDALLVDFLDLTASPHDKTINNKINGIIFIDSILLIQVPQIKYIMEVFYAYRQSNHGQDGLVLLVLIYLLLACIEQPH